MKSFRSSERGAVTGYTISVIVLAVLLIGGVILLKNFGGDAKTDKSVAVNTGEFKADDTKTDDTKKDDAKTEDKTDTKTTTNTVATVGTTEYTPEKITATGPEDFLYVLVGLLLVSGTFYLAWNYNKSRSALQLKLLQK